MRIALAFEARRDGFRVARWFRAHGVSARDPSIECRGPASQSQQRPRRLPEHLCRVFGLACDVSARYSDHDGRSVYAS
jgi:hypothetical protein